MPSAALERHPATPCAALRGITVDVERQAGALHIVYTFEGDIDALRIPAPRAPCFADGLWQHTCCELFVERSGGGYREFNFSPSGEWAAYEFDAYRTGRRALDMRPEIVLRGAQLEVSLEQDAARIGLSAVIEEEGGAISYWALRHAPGRPDFHHPDAFAMELG